MSDLPSDTPDKGLPEKGFPEKAEAEKPASEKPVRAGGVDPRLLELLVCPLTKTPLRYDADRQELVSDKASLAYPIRDGIPFMLVDEARALDDDISPVKSDPLR